MKNLDVGEIEGNKVEYNIFDHIFDVTINGKRFKAESFKALVRKVNEFKQIEWKQALIVPRNVDFLSYPISPGYIYEIAVTKVRKRGKRFYQYDRKKAKWIRIDPDHLFEYSEEASDKLKQLREAYKKLEEEWKRTEASLTQLE